MNLPIAASRAWIVTEVARYLISDEMDALSGPLWRRAFAAIAAVDNLETSALHKRFLVGLVRVAIARAKSLRHTSVVGSEELVEAIAGDGGGVSLRELVQASREGSEADRDALRLAITDALRQSADGTSGLDAADIASVIQIVPAIWSPAGELSGEVDDDLVYTLHKLSRADEPEVALRAIEALASVHPPGDVAFWIGLAQDANAIVTPVALFEVLGKADPEAGFAFLRAARGQIGPIAEVGDTLASALSAITAAGGERAHFSFGEFLASLPAEERADFLAMPALAGIEPVLLGRPLVRRFFLAVAEWSAVSHGDQSHPAVASQVRDRGREVLELAADVRGFFGEEELGRARNVLGREAMTAASAAVSVPTILALDGETTLARCVVEQTARTDEPWNALARWYLDVCPRDSLQETERERLFNALLTELSTNLQETPFLITLAQLAAERGEDLSELTESGSLPLFLRFTLERTMTSDYDNSQVVEELEEIAAAAV